MTKQIRKPKAAKAQSHKKISPFFSLGQPVSKSLGEAVPVMMTTTNIQLELGFNGTPARLTRRPETRVARAQWWFDRMRAAVKNAWPEPPPARPQQIWMPGALREIQV